MRAGQWRATHFDNSPFPAARQLRWEYGHGDTRAAGGSTYLSDEPSPPNRQRRWPWLFSAMLLLAAAAAMAWSTYLHWLPCQGSMLESTAFGLGHFIFDYAMMTVFSGADWDVPPGTGYGTALVLVVAALSTAMMTIRGDIGQPSDDRLAVNA